MFPPPASGAARRAFTLIELLTVISILAILAMILIPVTAKVRSSARAAHCSANLQQLGRAFALYADEHNGRLPAVQRPVAISWYDDLQPYLGRRFSSSTHDYAELSEVFRCPVWIASPAGQDLSSNITVGYAMSAALVGDGSAYAASYAVPLSAIPDPSRRVIVLENTGAYFPASGQNMSTFCAAYFAGASPEASEAGCERHGGSANYLFVDGHVGAMTSGQAQATLSPPALP